MKKAPLIATVGFNPPRDTHLAVEVLSIDELRQRAPAEHFDRLQRADFYRLIGVIAGNTSPMVDFSNFVAKPGDWVLVRPGQVFRYDFSCPWSGWLLVFRPDSLSPGGRFRASDDFDLQGRIEDLACLHSLQHQQHDWLSNSVRQMQLDGALSDDLPLRNELLRLALAALMLRLSLWQSPDSGQSPSHGRGNAKFRQFRKLLDADFATQHQVQHYANALCMSEKTLSRVCIAAAGLPTKALINQRLVLEAKRMLAHTNLTAHVIGRELGFVEATNFVKFFRKATGMPPLAFRGSLAAANSS